MDWLTFKNSVLALLTVDSNRLNTQTYTAEKIRHAVEDILWVVPFYRKGQESIFDTSNMTQEGFAHKGVMPPGAVITNAEYYQKSNNCARRPIDLYDWMKRYALICGYECLTDCGSFLIAIDPHGASFYIYPNVDDDHAVVLEWETTIAGFIDTDIISFGDNRVIEAVAFKVKAEIIREVDKDIPLSESYLKSYSQKRTQVYLEARKRELGMP